MKKECCNIKVDELDDGFRLEITGKEIKEKVASVMKDCCSDKGKALKEIFRNCCASN